MQVLEKLVNIAYLLTKGQEDPIIKQNRRQQALAEQGSLKDWLAQFWL